MRVLRLLANERRYHSGDTATPPWEVGGDYPFTHCPFLSLAYALLVKGELDSAFTPQNQSL